MVKYNWNIDYDEVEIVAVNDNTFRVKKVIPFETKMAFAKTYAEIASDFDDDGFASVSSMKDAILFYLLIKYYTDIETYDDDNIGWIYDYNIKYGMRQTILNICEDDYNCCITMAMRELDNYIEKWNYIHSIQHVLLQATDEKVLDEFAKMKPIQDQIMNAISNKDNANDSVVSFDGFAKKNK